MEKRKTMGGGNMIKVNVKTRYSNGQLDTSTILNKTDALKLVSHRLENSYVVYTNSKNNI